MRVRSLQTEEKDEFPAWIIMANKRIAVAFSIDRNVLKKFRRHCAENGLIMSRVVEMLIKNELKEEKKNE